jgi:DNA-binding CsgD family transcriptional regulator
VIDLDAHARSRLVTPFGAGDHDRHEEESSTRLVAHALRLIVGVVPCSLAGFYKLDDRLRKHGAVAMAPGVAALDARETHRDRVRRLYRSDPFDAERFTRTDLTVVTSCGPPALGLFVRARGRMVGGMTLLREEHEPEFSSAEVMFVRRLQPLIELAYTSALACAASARPDPLAFDMFTDREREVARLVARGATNAEIAAVLGIRERTVKAHLTRVFAKAGLRSRTELAARLLGTEMEGHLRLGAP